MIITSASKIFDKYSDVKTAIKGALESYRAHGNKLQTIVTKSWGTQGLEKQIKKQLRIYYFEFRNQLVLTKTSTFKFCKDNLMSL